MELVTVVASIVGASAAAVALFYAHSTVKEARKMRREDARERRLLRLERISDLIKELAEIASERSEFYTGLMRLQAALVPEPNLKECHTLVTEGQADDPNFWELAHEALAELADAMRAELAESSRGSDSKSGPVSSG